jgi:hypothetical protein
MQVVLLTIQYRTLCCLFCCLRTYIKIYEILILPVILYGCETWSLTLWEEHRLKAFENGVLRRIFGLKRDEVAGYLGQFHDEVLHNLYLSPSIIRMMKSRRMRMVGHVARMWEKRNACRILVAESEVCMYVCVRGGPNQPLHRDPQWSIVLPLL